MEERFLFHFLKVTAALDNVEALVGFILVRWREIDKVDYTLVGMIARLVKKIVEFRDWLRLEPFYSTEVTASVVLEIFGIGPFTCELH